MRGEIHLKKTVCLLILLAAACSPAPVPVTPSPPVSATRESTSTPAPTPTLTPFPTDPIWTGWSPFGENLALKKRVRVSNEIYGFGGAAAVDGSLRTRWNSGEAPVQWIEIDLGEPHDIAEIRLLPANTLPGVTVHHVLGKSPLGVFKELYTFESQVSDSPLLANPVSGAWRAIRYVRVETTFSPGPVGWTEIQVIAAGPGE